MAVTVSFINMKGGVGKTTLCLNMAWYAAGRKNKLMRVLAVDIDPQSNLSQYFMGAENYKRFIEDNKPTVFDIFEQFSPSNKGKSLDIESVIQRELTWSNGSLIDLIPCRHELAWTLKHPTEKAHLLPKFLDSVKDRYDLILIDCAPSESILSTAAYLASKYVLVPVKPEFLATIGLPLLARSLDEFKQSRSNHEIELAGIVFNDSDPQHIRPEHNLSRQQVKLLAQKHGWKVFKNECRHSRSYAAGARKGQSIFGTKHARKAVKAEFRKVGDEFLARIGL